MKDENTMSHVKWSLVELIVHNKIREKMISFSKRMCKSKMQQIQIHSFCLKTDQEIAIESRMRGKL
jgi:hypothetical protein